ncbi:hypothetical protein DU478_21505 [Thalassococcus profundi]|uniref:Uncharacterized protein n=1 Tax=Thalassococcus profundi TaxID=2282382 RepID=A0A369TH78_9RHOB|nr:hypothetical protein [Thalassococcus profundi]RDD64192.1 hypothetical protein DU478_21505 [Thalassococcus profundi]
MPSRFRTHTSHRDWRCKRCFKLLGRIERSRVQLVISRSHQYLASVPISSVCRCCGTLNEMVTLP